MENFQSAPVRPAYAIAESQSALLRSVFSWMTIGLLLTGGVASYVLATPSLAQTLLSPGKLMALMVVELGLVLFLSVRVNKMSAGAASATFLLYSALNGITLAPLALYYTGQSISQAFVIAASAFAGMAMYGYVTKRDLSGWGSFLMMGLIGILVSSLVLMFFHSGVASFAVNIAGVIVFTGLTAYDVQRIKHLGDSSYGMSDGGELAQRRIAIVGALSLYLNFINLFITMLRLVGNRD